MESSIDAIGSKGTVSSSILKDIESNEMIPGVSYAESSESVEATTTERAKKGRFYESFIDSFKRAEIDESSITEDMTEAEKNAVRLSKTPLSKSIKQRHLQMIAIGGSVGTGLFVGSGSSLRTGGAASLPICWGIVGTIIFCVIHALGELAVTYPISGAFSAHATRFIEPSWGAAVGWNYVMLWLVVLPLEIIAASLTIQFWNDKINPVAWVAIFYVIILAINLVGVQGYAESEYIFSIVKVLTVLGFLILGIVLVCGGERNGAGFIGGKYYHDPGPFANGFKGVCTVFVTATYSLGGSELVGLSGAELKNPRKALPTAIKQVFWRIMLFYLGSLTLISLLVSSNDHRLLGTSSVDASASPFVIAIKNGGIKGLPSVMNVVILISVLSVGNSAMFGSSRTLTSLATQGLAPKCFSYVDKRGRPLFCLLLNAITGLLCFIVASNREAEIFSWLLSISGLAVVFVWISICLCHIRFRLAMKAQGRSLDEVVFKSHAGLYGSIYACISLVLILVAQFWVSLFPVHAKPSAETFFQNYLGFVIVVLFYFGRKIYIRKFWELLPLTEIPLDVGRSEIDLEQLKIELRMEREELMKKPFLYRAYKFWC